MLIEFAADNRIVIKSKCFAHRKIHKGTWNLSDGKTINQIDQILIPRTNNEKKPDPNLKQFLKKKIYTKEVNSEIIFIKQSKNLLK